MKKLTYSLCIGAAVLCLSSCSGREEYDAYVDQLKAQPEVIDTISSPQSYANYLDRLATMAEEFDQLGLKLNDTQKDSIKAISEEIQFRLTDKYNALAQTPAALPDDIVILEADAPVEAFTQTGAAPQLQ